jgi:hypothetical protein
MDDQTAPCKPDASEILSAVGWEPCSPEWVATHRGECGTAPRWSDGSGDRLYGDGDVISHWHPTFTRAEVIRGEAVFLREIGTPITGERSEHERGIMYAAERLNLRAAQEQAHGQ